MAGRKSLPHQTPSWVDPASEIWFVTICCAQRGANQLTRPETSRLLLESVAYRFGLQHWYPHIFLLMPDHCHALLSFAYDREPAKTIREWKRWTAGQYGIVWQTDFFDHRLRSEESFADKANYIRENPVRAGLTKQAEDWPHVWMVPEGL